MASVYKQNGRWGTTEKVRVWLWKGWVEMHQTTLTIILLQNFSFRHLLETFTLKSFYLTACVSKKWNSTSIYFLHNQLLFGNLELPCLWNCLIILWLMLNLKRQSNLLPFSYYSYYTCCNPIITVV